LVMPSEHGDHLAWLIIAISGQCQDVSVVGNVQIESDMCATHRAFTPFCSIDLFCAIQALRHSLRHNYYTSSSCQHSSKHGHEKKNISQLKPDKCLSSTTVFTD